MIFFLIFLIFFSKVSLAFIPFFPKQIDPVIFQYGLHPYVNIGLNIILGSFIFLKWQNRKNSLPKQSILYKTYLFLASCFLLFITFMQSVILDIEDSFLLQISAACMAIFTIYLYGRMIPTVTDLNYFLKKLKTITVFFCLLSLILLIVSPATCFKGTRFIGVFKHIPHMVSCAMICCFSIYYSLFVTQKSRFRKIVEIFFFLIALFLLVLTGTRSALAAVLLGCALCFILFSADRWQTKFLKSSIALFSLLVVMFFGVELSEYAIAVVRGEQSIAQRAAQDGVQSRIEEVERGLDIFYKNPWLGQGLLSKFSNGQEAEISGYNANKDPHNLFISAGTVGGWGLMLITAVGFFGLLFRCFKKINSFQPELKMCAIYLMTQIPILFIYHLHVSIGGIADRIYWLFFGFLFINKAMKSEKVKD